MQHIYLSYLTLIIPPKLMGKTQFVIFYYINFNTMKNDQLLTRKFIGLGNFDTQIAIQVSESFKLLKSVLLNYKLPSSKVSIILSPLLHR